MTFHEPIALSKAEYQHFVWPDLPEVDEQKPAATGIFTHQIAGQVLSFTGPIAAPDEVKLTLTIRFGDEDIYVLCPAGALDALMDLHNIADNWQRYTPMTAALVFEHLLTDALAPIAGAMGGPFVVVAVDLDGEIAPAFGVQVALQDGPDLILGIAGAARILDALHDQFAALAVPPKLVEIDDLPFAVALLGPSFTVDPTIIASCKPGDGFLLERDWSTLARAELAVAGRVCASASHDTDGFRLKLPPSFPTSKETSMSTTAEHNSADPAGLPVTLRLSLGETTLTLSQIRELEMGSVLPFANEMPTTVGLTANGKPFGKGELVRIDGHVAVRLTEIG